MALPPSGAAAMLDRPYYVLRGVMTVVNPWRHCVRELGCAVLSRREDGQVEDWHENIHPI